MKQIVKLGLVLALVGVIAAAPLTSAQATGFKVLHSFSGTDGGSPNALIQTPDGLFYGTAATGGDINSCPSEGCGTVFKSNSTGKVTVLHTFHGSDGSLPTGLMKGSDGNFYGTTNTGGQLSGGGAGTFFRMDPAGNLTVLYAFVGGFACCDGAQPMAHPVQASDGNLYGTTFTGGAFRDIDHQGGFGTVYQFNPTTGIMTILHSFNLADGNGIFPNGPLVQGTDGFLYGTTQQGGATAFRIDTAGNFSLVAKLLGTQPLSGLIQAKDGFFYGTDEGISGSGTVYRVAPTGTFTSVNLFDGADGYRPNFRLLQAPDGFFYGSTPQGGLLDFQGGDIFRLNSTRTLVVLHSFKTTGTEGYRPNSEFIQGLDGMLYGVNGTGGASAHGTLFRINPHAQGPVASITAQPKIIKSGQSGVGTVTLFSPAPAGGTIVTLGALQGQIIIPATVTVPAGSKTVTFTINTQKISATTSVRIYASVAGQGVRTTVTVQP
jgi:uncharacterized repeat protein (TIGR03803 family)